MKTKLKNNKFCQESSNNIKIHAKLKPKITKNIIDV